MQSLLHAVIQAKPTDPYAYMIEQLSAAQSRWDALDGAHVPCLNIGNGVVAFNHLKHCSSSKWAEYKQSTSRALAHGTDVGSAIAGSPRRQETHPGRHRVTAWERGGGPAFPSISGRAANGAGANGRDQQGGGFGWFVVVGSLVGSVFRYLLLINQG